MIVGQLIVFLQSLPADSLVIMSRDEEGNGYSPFAEASKGFFRAETMWSGEVYSGEVYMDPAELAFRGLIPEDYPTPPEDAVPCIVLWPLY